MAFFFARSQPFTVTDLTWLAVVSVGLNSIERRAPPKQELDMALSRHAAVRRSEVEVRLAGGGILSTFGSRFAQVDDVAEA